METMKDDDQLQSHGITKGEMKRFGYNQQNNQVEFFEPNSLGTVVDKFFKEEFKGYKVAEHDAMHYHIAQESRSFDPQSGQRLSKASVQIYPLDAYKMMTNANAFGGMITDILHDPTKETQKVEAAAKNEMTYTDDELSAMTREQLADVYKEAIGRAPHHTWDEARIIEKLKTGSEE